MGQTGDWRRYIDLEHATCYKKENYWCALTDGKIKYVWQFYTGKEQLFDLVADPQEIHDCSADREYNDRLVEMRRAMADHLSERGDSFVKENCLVRRTTTLLYSPHYPKQKA